MNRIAHISTLPFLLGSLFAFVGAILFSSKAIFVKLGYGYPIGPVSLLTLRMLFALPFFAVMAYLKRPPSAKDRLGRKDALSILLLGLAGFYLASLFDFIGLTYITASLERLILFVYPTLVVIFDSIYNRRPIQRIQYLALVFTYAGLFYAFYDRIELGGQNQFLLGGLWILGAALSYSIYMVGSGRLIPKIGPMRYTAHAMIAAFVGVVTHYLLFGEGDLFQHSPRVYGIAFAIAIIATVIPLLLFSEAIARIGPSNTAIIGSIGPISTMLMAWYYLEEEITYNQVIGTFLVLGGVLYISLGQKRR
ncbi:MAG: DMT family transporter [Bacteroidota bacterium]